MSKVIDLFELGTVAVRTRVSMIRMGSMVRKGKEWTPCKFESVAKPFDKLVELGEKHLDEGSESYEKIVELKNSIAKERKKVYDKYIDEHYLTK